MEVIDSIDILIGFFDRPKKGPDERPLKMWEIIIKEIDELKRKTGESQFDIIKKNLLSVEFRHLFEGWESVGYQTSFSIGKRQLLKIKKEILTILASEDKAAA